MKKIHQMLIFQKLENVEKIIEEISSKVKNPSICVLPEGPQTIPYKQ